MDTIWKIAIGVLLLIIGSGITYVVTRLGKKQDRNVGKEDAEIKRVADTLESLRRETAEGLERDRKQRSDQLEEQHRKLVERIDVHDRGIGTELGNMRIELATIRMQLSPFWAWIEAKIARDLTHPSPQFREMDTLVRRLFDLTITPEELSRFDVLLEERICSEDPEVTEEEKGMARLLKALLAQTKLGEPKLLSA